ncbi:MAG: ParB N-terminal domain-containing protein [candidate division Zixibacteria bacterium]|nr:ParB N-terminal domain-containing protein [candidate division Zixibacteria bacterium]
MKIEQIPVSKLQANPWNPNRMSNEMRHKLKEYIKKEGFVEPIVVRPKDEMYEILGGYHRWSIAKELGRETVPCVVVDLDDKRAKILTINLNEMKGQSLPNLLSELVHDLSKEFTLDDLETQLPYSLAELNDTLEVLKIPDGLEAYLDEEAAKHEINKPQILSFVVDNAEQVEKAIAVSMAKADAKPTRGKALLDICNNYLTAVGQNG